ncbi:MAG: hypothetical protein QXV17_10695 [Candidatus Micrarchaeaceae archaeon]
MTKMFELMNELDSGKTIVVNGYKITKRGDSYLLTEKKTRKEIEEFIQRHEIDIAAFGEIKETISDE